MQMKRNFKEGVVNNFKTYTEILLEYNPKEPIHFGN